MENRVLQFRVGLLVLATLLITFLLVMYFGELLTLGPGKYSIHVQLPEAPGVAQGTPVRKHGIMIGRVEKVVFDDDDRAWEHYSREYDAVKETAADRIDLPIDLHSAEIAFTGSSSRTWRTSRATNVT